MNAGRRHGWLFAVGIFGQGTPNLKDLRIPLGAQFGREIGPIHPDCSRGHLRARAQFVSDFDDVAEERANRPHLMIGSVT
ncbi:MAG: hypothetical protein WB537_15765 [Pseudolabrys sp.]